MNNSREVHDHASDNRKYTEENQQGQGFRRDALPLSQDHLAQLAQESGIDLAVIAERGYRSVFDTRELISHGFQGDQLRPGLFIPVWDVAGHVAFCALRSDEPRQGPNSKPIKYDMPAGTRMCLDVHPHVREQLGNPAVPLYVTEGIKKGDALVSQGLCVVALLGVWNFRGTNDQGGRALLSDFEAIALNGRTVYIVFDSDVMTKREVHQALERLAEVFRRRAAKVKFIYLPSGPNGEKVGVDDFLAAGHTVEELLGLSEDALRPLAPTSMYFICNGGMWGYRRNRDEELEERPLATFTASIAAEVVHDDGVESSRYFEIRAQVGEDEVSVHIPATEFGRMEWVADRLGARAIIEAGQGTRDQVRAAIQHFSPEPETRRVYGHTGWREHEGEWLYLHAGGAIGADGLRADVQTALDALPHYHLPAPPDGEALKVAVQASLGMLDVAPWKLTAPLLAAIYRAVLGEVHFSLWLAGRTGVGKSELAALAQQHFGAAMDARNLPAAWASTANANEYLAFLAKDAVLVVDDYAPCGNAADVQRARRDVDRLLRGQGNGAGRARMTQHAEVRQGRQARGIILSTGEDTGAGQSASARTLTLDVGPHDVQFETKLDQAQQDAASGRYAQALAAFVRWLAPQYGKVKAALPDLARQYRDEVSGSMEGEGHRRTPDNAASLLVGLRYFVDFALTVEALDDAEAVELFDRGREAILEAAGAQHQGQRNEDPVSKFLGTLHELFAAGKANVTSLTGSRPDNPGEWGWCPDSYSERDLVTECGVYDEWRPQGVHVGWIDEDDLYLLPRAVYGAVQRFLRESNDALPVQQSTLWQRLEEAGLLAGKDKGRGYTKRAPVPRRPDTVYVKVGVLEAA